jgi:hypothetical protein
VIPQDYEIMRWPIGRGMVLGDLAIVHERKWGHKRDQTLADALIEQGNSYPDEERRAGWFDGCRKRIRLGFVPGVGYGSSESDRMHAVRSFYMARDSTARFVHDARFLLVSREVLATLVLGAAWALLWWLFGP